MKAIKKNKKFHIKKGDKVMIIAGSDKGKSGVVLRVNKESDRVVVEGWNMVKRHMKPSAKFPDGGIIEKEAGIHISNIMLIDPSTKNPTRIGRKRDDKGKLVRFSKKSGKNL